MGNIKNLQDNYNIFITLDTSQQQDFIKKLTDSLDNSEGFNKNISNKVYVTSMLLRSAVEDDNTDIAKLLLVSYKADPRVEDIITHESAVTCALNKGDLSYIKMFSNYFSDEQQSIKNDYLIIGSIYNAITGEHEYNTEDLLGALKNLYIGIDEIF